MQPNGAAPSSCYLAEGLLLSAFSPHGVTQVFTIRTAADAVSPPNVATGFPSAVPGIGGPWPDLKGEFFVSTGNYGWTNFLSLNITGSQMGQDPWQVSIFGGDSSLSLLGSVMGQNNRLVTFASSGPTIHMFEVFTGVPTQGIDNVTFNAATTPEPASLILLVSGLGAAALRRRHAPVERLTRVSSRAV